MSNLYTYQQQFQSCLVREAQETISPALINPLYMRVRVQSVDWCWKFGLDWDLTNLTIHTAVRIMDTCYQHTSSFRVSMALLPISSLVLSCKMHESRALALDQIAPLVGSSEQELRTLEVDMIRVLNWECDRVTLPVLAGYLVSSCPEASDPAWDVYLRRHTEFWCDLAAQDLTLTLRRPLSLISAACVVAARWILNMDPLDNFDVAKMSTHSVEDVQAVFTELLAIYRAQIGTNAKPMEIQSPQTQRANVEMMHLAEQEDGFSVSQDVLVLGDSSAPLSPEFLSLHTTETLTELMI